MKRALFILLFIVLFCFSGAPVVQAQTSDEPPNILLRKTETESLLDAIRKEPLPQAQYDLFNETIERINQPNIARQAGAVLITKQAILDKQLYFWLKQAPQEFTFELTKVVLALLPTFREKQIMGVLIAMAERATVQEAQKIITQWLEQYQIKMAVGEASYGYNSYKNTWQKATVQYIIMLLPTRGNQAEVVAEFYSANPIEPPPLRGSPQSCPLSIKDDPRSSCWPWDIWMEQEALANNDGLLEPFILRVKGYIIKKENGQFAWDKSMSAPLVEVDFVQPVWQIKESELILAWYEKEKQKSWFDRLVSDPLKDTLKNILSTGGTIWDALGQGYKSIESGLKNLIEQLQEQLDWDKAGAGIGTRFNQAAAVSWNQTEQLIGKIESILPDLRASSRDLSTLDPSNLPRNSTSTQPITAPPSPKLNLAALIEKFDDLSEKAESIFVEAQKILPQNLPQEQATASEPLLTIEIIPADNASVTVSSTVVTFTTTIMLASPHCSTLTNQVPSNDSAFFNEVAWMGSPRSANDEWIELAGPIGQTIDLSYWQIVSQSKAIKIIIPDNTFLYSNSYYLLERTDDYSVPQVKADLIYTGSLSNSNETLYLFDSQCRLKDRVQTSPQWMAGDNSAKKTMERKNLLEWQSSSGVGGTPKQPNSMGSYSGSSPAGSNPSPVNNTITPPPPNPPSTTTPTSTPTTTPTTTPTVQAGDLLISEIQLADDEFIELFNPANQDLDLSQLYLAYYSSARDWNNPYRLKKFSLANNTIIKSQGSYLIGLRGFSATSTLVSDWQPYTTDQLNNTSGAVAIFNCNPANSTSSTTTLPQAISQTQLCKIDAIGWGSAIVQEGQASLAPDAGQSLNRIINNLLYQDTDNNQADFITDSSTPTNSQNQTYNLLPPGIPANFQAVNQASGLKLSWNTATDPDSPSSSLSYIIYWSDNHFTSVQAFPTSTLSSTSTQALEVILSGLQPETLYYLGLKAFDGQYYSDLATTSLSASPSAVSTLQALPGASRESITLLWLSTGSATYELRQASKPIIENPTSSDAISWDNATIISTAGLIIKPQGQFELFNVNNLVPQTNYYFAIKAISSLAQSSALTASPPTKVRPGFLTNSTSTFTDLATGLMWIKDSQSPALMNGATTTQDEARSFLATLNVNGGFEGFTDWRLATSKELSWLLDFQKPADLAYPVLENIGPGCYWAAEQRLIQPALVQGESPVIYGWQTNFHTGILGASNIYDHCRFLAVRDTAPSACLNNRTDNQDGTFSIPCLNLRYQTSDSPIGYHDPNSGQRSGAPWAEAQNFASQTINSGGAVWRLPQANELMLIAPETLKYYWTLTPSPTNPDAFWTINRERLSQINAETGISSEAYLLLVSDI